LGESIPAKLGICCSNSPIVAGSRSWIACAPNTVSGVGARTPAGSRVPVTTMSAFVSGGAGDCRARAGTAAREATYIRRMRRARPALVRVTLMKSLGNDRQQKSPPVGGLSGEDARELAPTPSPRAIARRSRDPAPPKRARSRASGSRKGGGARFHGALGNGSRRPPSSGS
jgi:hypothetical protein